MESDPGPDPQRFDPRRPPEAELRLGVSDGFTLSAVGDCIISRPMLQYRTSQPAFASLLDVLAESDTVCGNLETVVFDHHTFAGAPYAWDGDWPLRCEPPAVADLARMGFGLLARANNHALDWGIEGMRLTSRHLAEQGLTHSGTGETLALARQAQFQETAGGRVGLVSCTSTYRDTAAALDQHDAAPGRPGVSAIRLSRRLTLPRRLHERYTALRDELSAADITDVLPEVEPGDGEAPSYRSRPDPDHLAAVLKEIRQGKQSSDLLVVALHSHEGLTSPDMALTSWVPQLPDGFVAEFGRAAIDAGADLVTVTGLHHLGPVLLHAGRPILTGLGNFFWSDLQSPLPADLYERNRAAMREAFAHPERATESDLTLLLNASYFHHEESFESVVAQLRFGRDGLLGLRLYPVDMGYGDPLPLSGLPRLAGTAKAERILARLVAISAAQGTEIRVRPDDARGTLVGELSL